MPAQRGKQFPDTGVGGEWAQNPENINLASKNVPKTQTTPVRNIGKVGGGENTILRMTPAPLTGGGATIYRKLGDSEGYPRGHTPEQMREVREAETSNKIQIKSDSPADAMTRITNAASSRKGIRHHPEHEKARTREIIARSKVDVTRLPTPTGDFNNLGMNRSVETSPLSITSTERISSAGMYSSYKNSSSKRKIHVQPDTLFPEKSVQEFPAGSSLIHEIGHDYDNLTGATKYAMEAGWTTAGIHSPSKLQLFENGHDEGYADKYATDNYVADPRDVKRNLDSAGSYAGFAAIGSGMPKGRSLATWANGYTTAGASPAGRHDPWLKSQAEVAKHISVNTNKHPDNNKYTVPKSIAPGSSFTGGDVMRAAGRKVEPKPKNSR